MVSLTGETDAAAGFYIPLAPPRWHRKSFRTASRFPMPTTPEQPDFAHAKSFVLCSFQPTKSACSAAAEKCLSGVGQPLSSVSGRKRYNTLDFPKENRVPTGMLLAPIGNPEPKGLRPSGHFIYFLRLCIYKTAILFCTLSRLYISHSPKTKNPTDFIFNGRMKPVGFLYHCVKMCIAVHIVRL